MNNRVLGIIAMISAPFLFADFYINGQAGAGESFRHNSLSGVFSLVYMIGWVCSVIGLWRLHATGTTKLAKSMLVLQLLCLSLANVWNIYEIIEPAANTTLYFALDMFWPISNLVLLFVGLSVVIANVLQGWQRYAPLMAGIWLPIALFSKLLFSDSFLLMMAVGLYTAIAWFLLGLAVATHPEPKTALIRKFSNV